LAMALFSSSCSHPAQHSTHIVQSETGILPM
jgi:hypothetical protein